MSVQAIWWAFQQDPESASAKLVLLALANHADDLGTCWPSQKTLAKLCSLSDRTVREMLAKLEALDLIGRAWRERGDGGRSSDLITLKLPPELRAAPPEKSAREGRKPRGGPPPENSSGLTLFESTTLEPKGTNRDARTIADEVWNDAPLLARQRSSYAKTLSAVVAAMKGGKDPEMMIRRMRGYYASPDATKSECQFAAGVHTAVGDGRWESFPEMGRGKDEADPELRERVDRMMMESWVLEPGEWVTDKRGPAPDEPGCRIPVAIMAEYGYSPGGARPEPRLAAMARSARYRQGATG